MLRSLLNPDYESVTTEDALNSEIGDGVDYLDPSWLALTDAIPIIKSIWESTDGITSGASGSGSFSNRGDNDILTSTGSTSGSTVDFYVAGSNGSGRFTWDKELVFEADLEILDSVSDRTDTFGTGQLDNGDAAIAFRLTGGTLEGVVHNGTSETTTTLQSSPSTGNISLRFRKHDGTVTFYVDGSKGGSISNGLPSGSRKTKVHVYRQTIKNSTAADRRALNRDTRVVQLP